MNRYLVVWSDSGGSHESRVHADYFTRSKYGAHYTFWVREGIWRNRAVAVYEDVSMVRETAL